MRLLLLASLVTMTLPLPFSAANAQSQDPILALPDGQVILNISATERREVAQDLLVASLSYVATGADSRALQNEVNTIMAKALETAKADKDLKVNTSGYQVYETTDPRSNERQWRAQQSLTIQSSKSDSVLTMAGKLQDMKLNMNGLNYMLSPETAVDVEDSLMEAALKQLQERADRAAKALGKSGAELRDVNVNSGGIPYQPMVRSSMMEMSMDSAKMAAPVAEAGDTTITLNVNARAILKP